MSTKKYHTANPVFNMRAGKYLIMIQTFDSPKALSKSLTNLNSDYEQIILRFDSFEERDAYYYSLLNLHTRVIIDDAHIDLAKDKRLMSRLYGDPDG